MVKRKRIQVVGEGGETKDRKNIKKMNMIGDSLDEISEEVEGAIMEIMRNLILICATLLRGSFDAKRQ